MMGAQASKEQLTKILSYLELGKQEGAEVLAGGGQAHLGGDLDFRVMGGAGEQGAAHAPLGTVDNDSSHGCFLLERPLVRSAV